MHRTSVELDEQQLARAQEALGTTGIKDTIGRALEEVIRASLRRRLAERLKTGDGIDRSDAILDDSRRWRA